MKSFLLSGGRVIDPANDRSMASADVLVIDGVIEAVDDPGQLRAPEGAIPSMRQTAVGSCRG